MNSSGRRPVAAEDIFALWTVGDAVVQPGGEHVAYAASIPVPGQREPASNIFVVRPDGTEPHPWTSIGGNRRPRWSPDGRWLGFLSRRLGMPPQVYAMASSGGEAQPVTRLARAVDDFAWSPDGQAVAVVAASGAPWAAQDDRQPEPARVIDRMPYRLNGAGYIDDRRFHLFRVDRSSGSVVALTDGPYSDTQPAWSPDGSEILFVSARHDTRDHDVGQDVFALRLDDLSIRQLTGTEGSVHDPVWCPDGCHVAYVGTTRRDSTPSHGRLFVMAADGGGRRRLAESWDRHVIGRPKWAEGHQGIYALAEDDGATEVWRFAVGDGEEAKGPERAGVGRRHVAAFDLAADSTWAVTVSSTPMRPPEIYREDWRSAAQPAALTHLHDAWCAEVALAEMEPYTAASPDGGQVSCWLMRPPAAIREDGESHPGLLKLHGGPFAQYGYGFSHEMQYWCSQGYTVFMANPRGSSGRDEDWARSLGMARGVVDYEDVLAALDAGLTRDTSVDPDRLAVNGGSYGGYLTSWIVGHTNRFRAACSEAAPNNLYSMSGTGDMAGRNRRLQYGFTAQENPEFFWRASPIAYALDITTPVLIIHGENDYRVPIEQGEQLFAALYFQGKPARLVRFPNEHHGLARGGHPAHRLERLALMREWFVEHGA